jgi:aminomethyltransferase
MVPFAGWDMPVQYTSIKAEHAAVRERAGLFDVSHMGQIYLSGPRTIEATENLLTCHVADLGLNRARYGLLLNEDGGCIDDVMVTRIGEDQLFLCVNASNVAPARDWIESRVGNGVEVDDRSPATSLIAFQGPAAAVVLKRLTLETTPLPKRFRVAQCEIAGLNVLASGTGYTGSPGYELYAQNEDAPRLFDTLLAEGAAEGVLPAGLGARDTLRLEAALPLYGHELDLTTSPFEAGLDRFVKPLESGFIGSHALLKRNQNPDPRRLVGFEMTGRGIARADYEIAHEGEVVGRVTSGAPSPTLGKSIGLGYVPQSLSDIGQSLTILIRGKEITAKIVDTPFK